MRLLGISPEEIDCALISHHHGDHGGGVNIAQRNGKCNFIQRKNSLELGLDPGLTSYFGSLDLIKIGEELSVLPVPVPHSGSDNVAFIASYKGERAAVITDLGRTENL